MWSVVTSLLFILAKMNKFIIIILYVHVNNCGSYRGENNRFGEFCTLSASNTLGLCTTTYGKDFFGTAEICEFGSTGAISLICESINKTLAPGTRSQWRCDRYYKAPEFPVEAVSPNSDIETAKALLREFPHMAAVGYGEKPTIQWLCGGTLISNQFVVTAAHCTRSREAKATWVRLGDLDLDIDTDDATPVDVPILQSYVHPKYKAPSHYHDIALLKIGFVTGFFYKPACLHTGETFTTRNVQAIGWGRTAYTEERSSHLLKANLSILSDENCKEKFQSKLNRRLKDGIRDDQICASDLSGGKGDTCQGDSGGPLHYIEVATEKIDRHFALVGVTSFGDSCGFQNSVGVYTKINKYLEWIEDIVWPIIPTEEVYFVE